MSISQEERETYSEEASLLAMEIDKLLGNSEKPIIVVALAMATAMGNMLTTVPVGAAREQLRLMMEKAISAKCIAEMDEIRTEKTKMMN